MWIAWRGLAAGVPGKCAMRWGWVRLFTGFLLFQTLYGNQEDLYDLLGWT